MKNGIIIFLLALISSNAVAQLSLGTRLSGLSNTYIAVKDVFNVNGNPAGIANTDSTVIAVNYQLNNVSSELCLQNLTLLKALKSNVFGLSFERYGISDYRQIKTQIAFAKAFGMLSIGVNVRTARTLISEKAFTEYHASTTGFQYQLNKQLIIGSSIQFEVLNASNGLRTQYLIGLSYIPNKTLLVTGMTSYNSHNKAKTSMGLEYHPHEMLFFRLGLHQNPFQNSFGIGIKTSIINIEMAYQNLHNNIYTSQIGISYAY